MTIRPREVEARAYVDQYRNADGSPGNYRTDIIADLLNALDERNRQLNQARAKVSELAVKLAEARRRPASKSIIFRDHRCVRCRDGEKPCVQGHPNGCSWPHARND